jgi:hypothetical protein
VRQRQQRDGCFDPNATRGSGYERLRNRRVEVVWSSQVHVRVRDDEVFRDGNHFVAEFFGALGHDDLICTGHIELERLRQGFHADRVRHGKGKLFMGHRAFR